MRRCGVALGSLGRAGKLGLRIPSELYFCFHTGCCCKLGRRDLILKHFANSILRYILSPRMKFTFFHEVFIYFGQSSLSFARRHLRV